MEVFECIKTRRSVRRFEDRPVDHEVIRKAVDAAVWAPSWKNTQTPVLIAVSYVKGRCGFERDGSYSTDKKEGWQMFDAGVAAQTFALAAHAEGLGTVMLGIYDPAYISKKLGIPETEEVAVLIAAGYEAFTPDAPKRKSSEEVLRFL